MLGNHAKKSCLYFATYAYKLELSMPLGPEISLLALRQLGLLLTGPKPTRVLFRECAVNSFCITIHLRCLVPFPKLERLTFLVRNYKEINDSNKELEGD